MAMEVKRKIKVLVVDDSVIFRKVLASSLSKDPSIEIVDTASDPYMARDMIIQYQPDVMTLDVEMPKMNGIEFLKRLMPQYPIPVVVVSSLNDNVFDALNSGAVDFVNKPDMRNQEGLDLFFRELIIKIKIASVAKVGNTKSSTETKIQSVGISASSNKKIIAIGASTGGTEAIYDVIRMFPKDMPGTVIVQHMPPVFTKMYADRLNSTCDVEVKEAENGDVIKPGRVLIAPGDYHMRIKKSGSIYTVECFKGEKLNGHCPSVDILFKSVADQAGKNAIGVILTGMGYDGAKGLLEMREKGARTIGQNEESCIVYGMPKVAFDIGAVEKQATLKNISKSIYSLALEQ